MNKDIIEIAKQEIRQEQWRQAVEKEKARLRAAKWWHKFVPFKITITRR